MHFQIKCVNGKRSRNHIQGSWFHSSHKNHPPLNAHILNVLNEWAEEKNSSHDARFIKCKAAVYDLHQMTYASNGMKYMWPLIVPNHTVNSEHHVETIKYVKFLLELSWKVLLASAQADLISMKRKAMSEGYNSACNLFYALFPYSNEKQFQHVLSVSLHILIQGTETTVYFWRCVGSCFDRHPRSSHMSMNCERHWSQFLYRGTMRIIAVVREPLNRN